MRVGLFDLETTGLNADDGIVLCGCIKEYRAPRKSIVTVRADEFPSWETQKTDNKAVVVAIMQALEEFDILVAHNGQFFDKAMLNSYCLKYGMKPTLRGVKFIDPYWLAKRHMRLHSNSQHSVIKFLGVKTQKTHVDFSHWTRAGLDGNRESMDYIVDHCVRDIYSMEEVYDYVRQLVKRIDDGGSAW